MPRQLAGPWVFRGCVLGALVLHGFVLFRSPELRGGADLLPHLRLIEQMADEPALRSVYAPAYHVLGALVVPGMGVVLYAKLFALLSVFVSIAGFRSFQRAAELPDESAILFVLWPYAFASSQAIPKVEVAGYGLAFFGLGLLLRHRHSLLAPCLAATFLLHTASALFLGIAGGVLALARRDVRGLVALATGTLLATPLFAVHVAEGCTLPEAFLFSRNDYLRASADWSSVVIWDRILLLASPVALAVALAGAPALWRRSRPLALLCAVLAFLYLNELWLSPLETRTSLDLLRGLSLLVMPVAISGGVWLHARPRVAPWLLGVCACWAVATTFFVAPGTWLARQVDPAETRGVAVERCTFRWSTPARARERARSEPGAPLPVSLSDATGAASSGLVFVRQVAGGSRELARARLSDGAVASFVAAAGDQIWPFWSPQAAKLVFQSGPAQGPFDLYLWQPGATAAEPLTRTPRRDERWPEWSPDGGLLAYAFRGARPRSGVAVLDVAARRSRVLATSGQRDFYLRPSFAPEADRLVAQRRRPDGTGSELWLLVERADPRPLLRDAGWLYTKARFTREGAILLSRAPAAGGPRDLLILDAPREAPRTIASTEASDDHSARPSPERREIAFISDRDGTSELFVAGLDGSGARNLSRSPDRDEVSPRWSPDGERLVVTSLPLGDAEARGRAGESRVAVFDREGRLLFETPGSMADWMPAWSEPPPASR